jgi:hypothetical protein
MSSHSSGQPPLHDHCSLCGAAIRWGDPVVTIERHEEQVRTDGDIEVTLAEVLVSLCAECGRRFPSSTTRVELGGQSFVGPRWPQAASDVWRLGDGGPNGL